jgi:hypothetical protein
MANKQSSRNRGNGRRAENIVARYLDLWDKRTLASGAGVGLTDIIDKSRKLYIEVKYGKSAVSKFIKSALKQAEDSSIDVKDPMVIAVCVPTGVGEQRLADEAIVVMRPDTFKTLLNLRDKERDQFIPQELKIITDSGEEHEFERK